MIQIYNTLSKKKEILKPASGKKIRMFVCGPTVYDYIHLGNARTFVIFDLVAKYLRYRGYKVKYIQNITDIDDKIINRAQSENKASNEIAENFFKEFLNDMKSLKVSAPDKYARASDHIKEVIKQVKTLIKKEHAYLIENDGYYFDLTTFPDYGKLSRRTTLKNDDAISRIDENPNKKNYGDFALWKFSKPNEPSWKSSLGAGRPGWHIEDTAITQKYFGAQYELHGGGQDLIFPHHEAEIAQQESASEKKPFVKYWMHAGFLINKKAKMSKSLGNFLTAHEALKKYPPQVLRLYFFSSQYRSPLEYDEDIIDQNFAQFERIQDFLERLYGANSDNESKNLKDIIKNTRENITLDLDDDFNTSRAISRIFDFIKEINILIDNGQISRSSVKEISKFIEEINKIFEIFPKDHKSQIPGEVKELAKKREDLRKLRNWSEADKIRQEIEKMGYEIKDTPAGPKITKSQN